MTRGPRSGLVPVVLLPILLVGCGLDSPSERDVCTQYRQFQASTDALRRLNPQTATADQYRAAADKAMLDLQEAANTASDKVFAAARPMLADSAANLKQSLAALQSEVQNLCPNTR